jgi:hypothetical protein
VIEKTLIDGQIPKVRFACDLAKCKGACCTMPGYRGAPVLESELEEIEKAYPVIRKHLSYQHQDVVEERGLFQGRNGDRTTQVVEGRACVFVTYEDGIAKCAFEKACLSNEISWRKPISCHLFPIRVEAGLPERIRYEHISQCEAALERGGQEKIPLVDFLKSPLIRAYGEEWYAEFLEYCREKREMDERRGSVLEQRSEV